MTQRKLHYTRTEATPETFVDTVQRFRADGGKGCNITAPFKQLALTVCDALHTSAELAQAVNTIQMHRDGRLIGYNTDGIGLLIDIQRNLHFSIKARRVLMLGAGGATRGALGPLLAAEPETVVIANRTVEKANALSAVFKNHGNIQATGLDALTDLQPFDLVINATSMGFNNEVPEFPAESMSRQCLAYDMMYNRAGTPFTHWCDQQGVAKTSDGFGMLVEQAAEAFLVWEGVRPKTRMLYRNADKLTS